MGKIKGYDVRVQLYTVPGQVKYNATRRLVLRNVDGIVFVADSMAIRESKNILSLKKLQQNLAHYNRSIFEVPMVMQYNKRDLKDHGIPILSVEDMERRLNSKLKTTAIEASALVGFNVVQTLKNIVSLSVSSVRDKFHRRVLPIQGHHHKIQPHMFKPPSVVSHK